MIFNTPSQSPWPGIIIISFFIVLFFGLAIIIDNKTRKREKDEKPQQESDQLKLSEQLQNHCEICGQTITGDYKVCQNCYNKMQAGELEQCKNCGKWNLPHTICDCMKKKTQQEDNAPNKDESDVSEENNKGCLKPLIITLILSLIIPFGIWAIYDSITDKDKTNPITEIIKAEPTITCPEPENLSEITTLHIYIKANDNYDMVTVKLTIYDKEGTVITQELLTETNLIKGETYTLKHTFTLTEILNFGDLNYMLYEYK